MDYRKEQALERLVDLMDTMPTMDAASVLEIWRNERDTIRLDNEKRLRIMADETVYHLKRMDVVALRGAGDSIGNALKPVERVRVRRADLAEWAKQNGIKLSDLMDVLEMRRRDVEAKGKLWMNGHLNAYYPVQSVAQADELEMQRQAVVDAQKHVIAAAKRAERLKDVPTSFVEPVETEWRPK